jgi:Zn-dependent protease
MGMNWWVADAWNHSPVLLVSWVVWVIGSIVLHELAHGWAAIWCGDRTPIETGHMTWNPLVHMGQMSLIMFAAVGIAWGQMPVDPSRFRGRYDDAKVALAGPMMNLLLAAFALVCYVVVLGIGGGAWISGVRMSEPLYSNVELFFRLGVLLNTLLMLFNLVPIPPLDGSRIVSDIVPAYRDLWRQEQMRTAGLVAFIALFYFGSDYIWSFAAHVAGSAIGWSVKMFAHGSAWPQGI